MRLAYSGPVESGALVATSSSQDFQSLVIKNPRSDHTLTGKVLDVLDEKANLRGSLSPPRSFAI